MLNRILKKSLDGVELGAEEIADLFHVPAFSEDSARIQAAARAKTLQCNSGLAEVHAQIGLNVAPCPGNCKFCAFAALNGLFSEAKELPPEEVVLRAKRFEADGANAVFLMSTAEYSFGRFVETATEVRKALDPATVMIANVGDFDPGEARRLKETGFTGVYHAVRMGEGRDSRIPVERRLATIRNAKEAGLTIGTCVEPVGPEHTVEELVEKTLLTREMRPAYSGAARRILIPGSELARFGMVSEARMAHVVAVIRLALDYEIAGNCTHEPSLIGAAAGANLLWAEMGSNPRDTEAETEKARGRTVADCRHIFEEAEIPVLTGPSTLYRVSGT